MPPVLPPFKLLIDAGEASVDQVFNRMEQAATDGWHRDRDQEWASLEIYRTDRKSPSYDGPEFALFTCDQRGDRDAVTLVLTLDRSHVLALSLLLRKSGPGDGLASPILADFVHKVLKPACIAHALFFSGANGHSCIFSSKILVQR